MIAFLALLTPLTSALSTQASLDHNCFEVVLYLFHFSYKFDPKHDQLIYKLISQVGGRLISRQTNRANTFTSPLYKQSSFFVP